MSYRASLSLAVALLAGPALLSAQSPSAPPPASSDTTGCCRAASASQMKCMQGMQDMQGMGMQGMGMHRGMQGMGMQGGMPGMGGQMKMPMPSAADQARLDSLVTLMHRSKGDKKLAAMEKVLDELLAHRAAMLDHMREMQGMDGGGGMAPDHSQHQ